MSSRGKKARRDYRDADGNKLKGVTTIMGDTLGWKTNPLMWWAAKLGAEEAARHVARHLEDSTDANKLIEDAIELGRKAHVAKKERAADLGKIAHAIAESILTGEPFEREEESWTDELIEIARPNGERIVAAIFEAGLKPKFIEQAFIGPGFGGSLDLICEDADGLDVLVDYKSGKHVGEEVVVQQGAYSGLAALHGINISRGVIVHAIIGEPIRMIPITKRQLDVGGICFAALFTVYQSKKLLEIG